jgi:2-keto-4-pentenoate hydratase/2-oxohepta-3-ene-1,7-dioic acid hydratase in catechol pathway
VKLTTYQATGTGPTYGLVLDGGLLDLGARLGNLCPDLRSLLADPEGLPSAERFTGHQPDHSIDDVAFLPVIPDPAKIICVGLNYEDHRLEAGLPLTSNPALFLRTPDSQIGHRTPILRPKESTSLDYEAELAVVIGRGGRRIPEEQVLEHVAGYACYNDGSVRDYQRHTQQYTAGKNFPHTGAFGPWMVTADDVPDPSALTVTCRLNGEVMQNATTEQLLFSIPELIAYISTVTALAPGDVIVTGTPAGVGSRRDPQLWMKPGDVVEVEIDRIGVLSNPIADE